MIHLILLLLICFTIPESVYALDLLGNYSYLHVSFESVWHLFLFIAVLVMMPFMLLIWFYWKYYWKDRLRNQEEQDK